MLLNLFFELVKGLNKTAVLGVAKDVLVAVIIILIILTGMYAYARVWPPIVVIESSSMVHENAPYGRIGTIDAGDFTFVKKVDGRSAIVTYYQGRESGYMTYGNYGDVIIFQKNGQPGTPIIHRAIVWIEQNNSKYDIPELGWYGNASVDLPEFNLAGYCPDGTGFITKGDNNLDCDRSNKPVKPEWIIGVARCEIPWFGAIKLLFDDWTQGAHNTQYVSQDCWVMLVVAIALLIIIPLCIDYSYSWLSRRIRAPKERKRKPHDLKELKKIEFDVERK